MAFAIWLNPHVDWRSDYRGWPALRKLEYVDELTREIAGKRPPNRNMSEVEPLAKLRRTVRLHRAPGVAYMKPTNLDDSGNDMPMTQEIETHIADVEALHWDLVAGPRSRLVGGNRLWHQFHGWVLGLHTIPTRW